MDIYLRIAQNEARSQPPEVCQRMSDKMRATTVGIVSIGDMGLGMAKLLKAHGYRVITVAEGRRYGIYS